MLDVALIVMLIMDAVRVKNFRIILNIKFACSIVFYIIPMIYLAILKVRFGVFQPALRTIDFEYYKTMAIYVPASERVIMTFTDYARYSGQIL